MKHRQHRRLQVVLGAIDDRADRWVAAIPTSFGPAAGQKAAAAVYDDARAAVRRIADTYHGTVPPPPWPATPALLAAMKRIRTMRDGFAALQRQGASAQRWARDSGKVGPALVREGRAVYDELGRFVEKEASRPRLADIIPDWSPGWIVVAGLALWALSRESRTPARSRVHEFA